MAQAVAGTTSDPICRSIQTGEGLRVDSRPHIAKLASRVGGTKNKSFPGIFASRQLRPVVERFRIQHEKNVSEDRLKELGVSRWSKWECGPNVTTFWKWEVDELVYIVKGSLEITPEGCEDSAFFYAGDLVRLPKWLEANMTFDEDYEQYYKFFAYGD